MTRGRDGPVVNMKGTWPRSHLLIDCRPGHEAVRAQGSPISPRAGLMTNRIMGENMSTSL